MLGVKHDLDEDPDLTVTTCEADEGYGVLPKTGPTGELLGWHVSSEFDTAFGQRVVLLSDMCVGEPPIEEVVKVVSHEYLHDILEQEIDHEARDSLDNIVEDGNFIVDRIENHVEDDRPLKKRWMDDMR